MKNGESTWKHGEEMWKHRQTCKKVGKNGSEPKTWGFNEVLLRIFMISSLDLKTFDSMMSQNGELATNGDNSFHVDQKFDSCLCQSL